VKHSILPEHLGPLAPLVGIWEGAEGIDVAPSSRPDGSAQTEFRERMCFEALGPVCNGPQTLYGLRYSTTVWPLGDDEPFHEETGYWLWDSQRAQVMRCFMVPRGVTVLAGGKTTPDATSFTMSAKLGSACFGILSNPFLDEHFRTVHYDVTVTLSPDGALSYHEDAQLLIPRLSEPFHHTDCNRLLRNE